MESEPATRLNTEYHFHGISHRAMVSQLNYRDTHLKSQRRAMRLGTFCFPSSSAPSAPVGRSAAWAAFSNSFWFPSLHLVGLHFSSFLSQLFFPTNLCGSSKFCASNSVHFAYRWPPFAVSLIFGGCSVFRPYQPAIGIREFSFFYYVFISFCCFLSRFSLAK